MRLAIGQMHALMRKHTSTSANTIREEINNWSMGKIGADYMKCNYRCCLLASPIISVWGISNVLLIVLENGMFIVGRVEHVIEEKREAREKKHGQHYSNVCAKCSFAERIIGSLISLLFFFCRPDAHLSANNDRAYMWMSSSQPL